MNVSSDQRQLRQYKTVLDHFSKIVSKHPTAGPYEIAVMLEEEKDSIWE